MHAPIGLHGLRPPPPLLLLVLAAIAASNYRFYLLGSHAALPSDAIDCDIHMHAAPPIKSTSPPQCFITPSPLSLPSRRHSRLAPLLQCTGAAPAPSAITTAANRPTSRPGTNPAAQQQGAPPQAAVSPAAGPALLFVNNINLVPRSPAGGGPLTVDITLRNPGGSKSPAVNLQVCRRQRAARAFALAPPARKMPTSIAALPVPGPGRSAQWRGRSALLRLKAGQRRGNICGLETLQN
jgi:hypothetical protein